MRPGYKLLSTLFAFLLVERSLGARRREDLDLTDESDGEDDVRREEVCNHEWYDLALRRVPVPS